MDGHPASNELHSVFTWNTPFVSIIPFLYRYENKQFIKKFFDNGDLRLSSFSNYRKFPDNKLGDMEEGFSIGYVEHSGGSFMASTFVGSQSYCFCTSTLLHNALLSEFKRDSVFRIRKPIHFMIEVFKSMGGVTAVLHGNCIYVQDRILKEKTGVNLNPSHNGEAMDLSKVIEQVSQLERYFLKGNTYQQQSEYRIIFETQRLVESHVDIRCPEAIQYCEQV